MLHEAKGILRFLKHAIAIAACILLSIVLLMPRAVHAADPEWELFKQRFLAQEGRVVDNGQGNISHSEGQGYGMLLAVHHDDRPAFDLLWQWTRTRLQVRGDRLLAWKWTPGSGVTDRNNATDGDLLVAWALQRAAEKWQEPRYADEGTRIAQDIRNLLLRRTEHGLVMLPGMLGFERQDGIVVNLCYVIFPALRDIARLDPAPEWDELAKSGLNLLAQARFGRWGLPPDWLKLGEKLAPADGFAPNFGYDAVRIPLYSMWGGMDDALLSPYRTFWGYFAAAPFLPSWTSLKDDSVDSYDAPSGIRAIAQWTLDSARGQLPRLPELDGRQPYYSSVLLLLCKMAIRERSPS
jgi:endoglucanase